MYLSGWEYSPQLRQIDNLTKACTDPFGAGYCEASVRNGSEIIPANDSTTITRCIFNQSGLCFDGRSATGSGFTFNASALNNYDGILVDDNDLLFLDINATADDENNVSFAGYRISNYTINISEGTLDIMVSFK